MTKTTKNFIEGLASYINEQVVGSDRTKILNVKVIDQLNNRGHAIPVEIEAVDGGTDKVQFCPCFYAEELMQEYEGHTIAFIGEVVNQKVNEMYGTFTELVRRQRAMLGKTIDDFSEKDLILTAVPSGNATDAMRGGILRRDFEELGLFACIKVPLYDEKGSNNTYYSPIVEGRDATDEEWKRAGLNSLMRVNMQARLFDIPGTGKPMGGELMDANGFYDYFYLLNPQEVWGSLAEQFHAERVYIFPAGAYTARFVFDGREYEGSQDAMAMRMAITKASMEEMCGVISVFRFDCRAMRLERIASVQ